MAVQLVHKVWEDVAHVGQVAESLWEEEALPRWLSRFSYDGGDSRFARNIGENRAVDTQNAERFVTAWESCRCPGSICWDSFQSFVDLAQQDGTPVSSLLNEVYEPKSTLTRCKCGAPDWAQLHVWHWYVPGPKYRAALNYYIESLEHHSWRVK